MSYKSPDNLNALEKNPHQPDLEVGELAKSSREKAKKTTARGEVMLNGTRARTNMIMSGAYHPEAAPGKHDKEVKAGLRSIDKQNPEINQTAKTRQQKATQKAARKLGVLEKTNDKTLGSNIAESANKLGGEGANTQASKTEIARDYNDDPDRGVSEATA